MKPIRASNKNAISLQWAGLPIEYWIDLNILEYSPVSETLREFCDKFKELRRCGHPQVQNVPPTGDFRPVVLPIPLG